MRIISEKTGELLSQQLQLNKDILLSFNLEEGENRFTLLVYDKAVGLDKPITKSIVITRVKTSIVEKPRLASDSTTALSAENNFQTNPTDPMKFVDKQLRLTGKQILKKDNKISLEIDATEIEALVSNYIGEVRDKDGKITYSKQINQPKSLQTEEFILTEGKNTVTVYPKANGRLLENYRGSIEINCVECKAPKESFQSQKINIRSIIGYEQSGASSAKSEQHPFLNFFFSTPLNIKRKLTSKPNNQPNNEANKTDSEKKDEYKTLLGGFSVWGDVRLTTTPVQGIGSLANFSPAVFATNFVQGDSASKVNDLVSSFDFLVGFEQQIVPPRKVFPGAFKGRTSLSIIASAGAITPLSFNKFVPLYFNIPTTTTGGTNPDFQSYFSDVNFDGKTKVAFITPDRDRFFRQYYAGLRLKTFFDAKELENFPAMFDVTIGQNEAITTGLQGVILRADGSTPLSIGSTDFLYIFGSINMKLGKKFNQSIPPFFLSPATGGNLSDNDTAVISIDRLPFQTRNRDVFRIGVGINLFKLFKKDETPKQK